MSLLVSQPQYGKVVFTESDYIHPSNNKNTYNQKRDFVGLDDFQSNDDEDIASTNLLTLNIEADANHASDDKVDSNDDLLRRYTTRRMSIPGWSLDDHMKNKEKDDVIDGTSSPFTLSSWSPVSKLQLETFQSSLQQQCSQTPVVVKKVTQQCMNTTAQVVASPRKAFDAALAATKNQKKSTKTTSNNHPLFSSSNSISANQQKLNKYEEESYENDSEDDEEEEQRINEFQSKASLVKKKSPVIKRASLDSSFSGTTTSWLHQTTAKVGEKWNMYSASSRLTSFSRITQLITSVTTGISGISNTPPTTSAKTATSHTSHHHHTTTPMSSVDIAKRILNKSTNYSNNINASCSTNKKPTKSSLYGVTTVASDEEEAEYEKEQYDQFLYDNRSNNNNKNRDMHNIRSGGIQATIQGINEIKEQKSNTNTPSSSRTSSSATFSSNGTENENDVLFDFLLLYRSKSISE